MNQDPLDRDEDLIADELCAYQSRLNQGSAGDSYSDLGPEIPDELHSVLDDCRRCLDLLHETRSQAGFPSRESRSLRGPGSYPHPSHIGRFEIVELLGIGGFGVVFHGIDPVVGRDVAIKIPRPELLGSPELTERFSFEAAALARLDHPNIVPIYESNCFGVIPYIVMPFVSGRTLAEWLASGSNVTSVTAVKIARDLARAIAHAHEQGILHRDLKPRNVLLSTRNSSAAHDGLPFVPKLTDFGLAKWTDFNHANTWNGAIVGTTWYLSPEQAEGRDSEIMERSDVYGLGAILFELLTGNPPFHGHSERETIQKILREAPSFRASGPKNSIDLEMICLKCMEKDPANRYSSANALAEDLQRVLDGEPISARRISSAVRGAKWCRRHPMFAAVVAAACFGVLAIVVATVRFNSRLSSQVEIAKTAQLYARRTEQRASLIELEAKKRSYIAEMRNAKLSLDQGLLRQTLKLLDHYVQDDGKEDVRDFAWWQMWREINESSRILGAHQNGSTSVAVTRNGNLAASGGVDSIIRLWSLPAGNLIAELRGHESGAIESLDFSPTGERLVSAGEDGTVRVWDVASFRELFVRHEHRPIACHAIFSPQGDMIASGGADKNVRLWNSESGELLATLSGHSGKVRCLAFHPTEPILVSGCLDSTIRFWNLSDLHSNDATREHAIRDLGAGHYPRLLAFEPNGNSLIAATVAREILQISLQEDKYGEVVGKTTEVTQPRTLIWPAGRGWIVGLRNSTIRFADSIRPEVAIQSLKGHFGTILSIAAPADAAFLVSASSDGSVRYWPNVNERSRILAPQADHIATANIDSSRCSIQWSGPYLAADFQQQQVSILRMPSRELVQTISKNNNDTFALSPSGQFLLVRQHRGPTICYTVDDGEVLWTHQFSAHPSEKNDNPDFPNIDRSEKMATIPCQNELVIVSLVNSEVLQRFEFPAGLCQARFLETDGHPTQVVTTCGDGVIRFQDIRTGQLLRQCRQGSSHTSSLAISCDNQLMATESNDGTLRILRLEDMTEVVVIPIKSDGNHLNHIAFLNGSKLLAGPISGLGIWSIHESETLVTFPESGFSGKFAISPDGHQLAVQQCGSISLIDGTPQMRESRQQ